MTTTSGGRNFAYNSLGLSLKYMAKGIDESTADDSHSWISAEVLYD